MLSCIRLLEIAGRPTSAKSAADPFPIAEKSLYLCIIQNLAPMKQAFRLLLLGGIALLGSCAPRPRTIAYTLPAGEIKLISFNKRREAVLDMIEHQSPSVIGIQEGEIDQVRYLELHCPQFARIGVGRDDGAEGGEIMAIFYRSDCFDVPASGTFWLSETPGQVSRGWDAACNRTVTWAQLREKATGKEFYYLNTHFDHMGETARRESARMVADFVRERIPDGATVIVGGDLNTDAAHPDLAPLKEQLRIARDIADPTDRRGTFNGFGSAPGNIVIDHIFCRNVSGPALETLRDGYGAAYLVVFTFRLP